MNPERAWNAVLEQQKMEMVKGTYDTWVADATFVSFVDGIYTVSATSEHGVGWLDSRLKSTVERLLTGMLNQPVEVEFILRETSPSEYEIIDVDLDEVDLLGATITESLYRTYTRPDQAHYFPAYLFRWMPYLGPDRWWTLIATRQMFYQQKHCLPENGHYYKLASRDIGEIIGRNRQTVLDHFENIKMKWFFQVDKSNKRKMINGRPTAEANQYKFLSVVPPTPEDQATLINWLLENKIDKDPITVLSSILEMDQPHRQIFSHLPSPTKAQLIQEPPENPVTFENLILKLCRIKKREKKEVAKILGLVEKVSMTLVEGFGSARVSLYFMKHYVPLLSGTGAGLIARLMRNCYVSEGEIRDTFVIPNAVNSLQKIAGVTERTIRRYLPLDIKGVSNNKKDIEKRHLIDRFVMAKEKRQGGSVEFKMNIFDPLISAHEDEYNLVRWAISFFITALDNEYNESDIDRFVDCLIDKKLIKGPYEAVDNSSTGHILDKSNGHILDKATGHILDKSNGHILDVVNQITGQILDKATGQILDKSNGQIPDNVDRTDSRQKQYLIKFLTEHHLRNYLKTLLNTSNTYTPDFVMPEIEEGLNWIVPNNNGYQKNGGWSLDKILKRTNLSAEEKTFLKELKIDTVVLASYIFYMHSAKGASLHAPWRFILTKLKENPDVPMNGEFHSLARLSPKNLAELIKATEFNKNRESVRVLDTSLPGTGEWLKMLEGNSIFTVKELAVDLGLAEWIGVN